jgi:hypothetical protein
MAVVDQIGQAAGGGDNDIDAAVELANLRHAGHPAQHQRGRDLGATGQRTDMLFDLYRQLTGRGQDQGAGGLRRRTAGEREKVMQDRQHEGSGLAGAGLGDPEDVAPLKLRADGLRLDRRRGVETGALQRRRQRGGKAEIRERSARIRSARMRGVRIGGAHIRSSHIRSHSQNISFPPAPAFWQATAVLSQAKRIWRGRFWCDGARVWRALCAIATAQVVRSRFSLLAVTCGKKRDDSAPGRIPGPLPGFRFQPSGAWRAYAVFRGEMQEQSAF